MDKLKFTFSTHAVYSAKCDGNKLAEISNKQAFSLSSLPFVLFLKYIISYTGYKYLFTG